MLTAYWQDRKGTYYYKFINIIIIIIIIIILKSWH
jgi:hypothetical protein